MKIKNSVLAFLFLILIAISYIGTHDFTDQCDVITVKNQTFPEFQIPASHLDLAIEVSNSAQTLIEDHKLSSILNLFCRLAPLNFNFRNRTEIPFIVQITTRIPIFILGHALLN